MSYGWEKSTNLQDSKDPAAKRHTNTSQTSGSGRKHSGKAEKKEEEEEAGDLGGSPGVQRTTPALEE